MKSFKEIKEDVSLKVWEIRYKAQKKFNDTVKWCEDNKELAIALIPVGLLAMRSIGNTVKSIDRKIDLKKQEDLQELYVYDHSLGVYHKLRRPLKPSEKIEIDRRRQNGESKVQILASMGVLD